MVFGDCFQAMFIELFPIEAIIPPSRWKRFKAWCVGKQAPATVIRRVW